MRAAEKPKCPANILFPPEKAHGGDSMMNRAPRALASSTNPLKHSQRAVPFLVVADQTHFTTFPVWIPRQNPTAASA